MKTFLAEYLWRSLIFTTPFPKRHFSALYDNITITGYQSTAPHFIPQHINNQKIRMFINQQLMLIYQDFLTLHGTCFQDNNKKIVVLWWKTGVWKSYLLERMKEQWLIYQLFDEDLCNIGIDGMLFPLANKSFLWKSGMKKYIYKRNAANIRWKIDTLFLLDDKTLVFQKTNLTSTLIYNYLIHDDLKNKKLRGYIQKIYKKIWPIATYIIPNPHTWTNKALSLVSNILRWKKYS